ncbi:MAG: tRNA (adenosine(37)-N6)-threonylcarbamoyltransferase complex ATPase subunit type 1 TsaE [Paracoccaceae bacterium]
MDQYSCHTIPLSSPEKTAALAIEFAPLLSSGDTILLAGELGTGKTHFARAIIGSILARAGQNEDIPSPTFTLVQVYSDGRTDIWHADLYRVSDANDVVELGLFEAMDQAICLIEWPDRLGSQTPVNALTIELEHTESDLKRMARFSWSHEKWNKLADILGPLDV